MPWSRISDTPATLSGYGLTSDVANKYYNKNEIDEKLKNVVPGNVLGNVYTKVEINNMFNNVYTKGEVDEIFENVSVDNVYTKTEVDSQISTLADQIANILYKDIAIISLSNNINSVDKGRTIASVKIKWTTNRAPVAITLGNDSLDPSLTEHTYSNISSDTTWKLVVTGEHGEQVDYIVNSNGIKTTATTSVAFLNRVYYGAAAEPEEYNRDFILSLSGKTLSRTKVSPVNITTGSGQYMYYCLPASMGACTFTVGGFVGGFTKVKENFMFENQYNHQELYDIYRSDYQNLGLQKVSVT